MIADIKNLAILLAGVVLLSACAETEAAKERSVFLRNTVTSQVYSGDLALCETYVKKKGASSAEQEGAAVVGLLFGGLVGLAATSNSYDRSQNRLFEECMYGKGYRLVTLPKGFGTDPRDESDDFDRRRAALDLIAQNKAQELLFWENAKNSGSQEEVQAYLKAYSNGYFANDARKKLTGDRTLKKDQPK